MNPLLLSLESRVVEWDFGCIFPAFLLAMKLGGANFFLVFDHRSQTAFFFFCSSWCSNQSFLGSNQWMNEIQLFLAVMLSFKSSKGLIFFSMIFFEHTTVLVTFFRSFLFFLFYWNGIFWGWDSRGWGVFFGGSTLQTSSSVIAAELAQLKSRANWTWKVHCIILRFYQKFVGYINNINIIRANIFTNFLPWKKKSQFFSSNQSCQ